MDEDGPIIILITTPDAAEARRIADTLVSERLAACVNTLAGVSSRYRWQGKLEEANEVLLIVKSRKPLLDAIIKRVKAMHSYDVPEIIALPVVGGNEDYLKWLESETGGNTQTR